MFGLKIKIKISFSIYSIHRLIAFNLSCKYKRKFRRKISELKVKFISKLKSDLSIESINFSLKTY